MNVLLAWSVRLDYVANMTWESKTFADNYEICIFDSRAIYDKLFERYLRDKSA